ncbi:amino acid ABC transporter permease [Gandjariella thermophila]|uniref:Amino acid ABC transporter permease n=1 Tax=Gandjariella thermophila TaxID=1931992 RepID=A0A4D4J8Z0_9PSEU|nr:amino acid ABC transporter permease [Gandjariella thermophila]GDY30333.1 amino acid ABC transporter permease [Gandjariella thermophila]
MSSVLYDIPGPKAKARNATFGVVASLVVIAVLGFIGYRFAATGQFDPLKWSWLEYQTIQLDLLNALKATLSAFVVGAALALVFGAVFALARLSDHAWLRAPAAVVVEFFRAIPLVILIFTLYYALPKAGVTVGVFWSLVIGLTLYNGSVLAEVFRAGVEAMPKGQSEAAYALGLRKSQVMTTVLLPQAVRAMLPTIISQLVVLLKDTALGFLITYQELLFEARYLGGLGEFGRPIIPTAMVVAAVYISLCMLLSWLANYLERRNRRKVRYAGAAVAKPTVAETQDELKIDTLQAE